MSTMSASVKRRLSAEKLQSQNYRGMTATCCPGSNCVVILVRLRTGHNRLNSQILRKRKLAPSPTGPCGRDEQTTEHVLQRCPLYKATREDVWPVSTFLMTKLYICKQELEKTTPFIPRAALIVYTSNAKKKVHSLYTAKIVVSYYEISVSIQLKQVHSCFLSWVVWGLGWLQRFWRKFSFFLTSCTGTNDFFNFL